MTGCLIYFNNDRSDADSNKFVQSIFGQHADQESLLARLAEDYGVSLRSGEKYPPVRMTNPLYEHIRKHVPKTCKIMRLEKRKGHGHEHQHRHRQETLKRKHTHSRCHH